jgi:hypothetical protein
MTLFPNQLDFTPAEFLSRAWYYRWKAEHTPGMASGSVLLRLAERYEKMALGAVDGRDDQSVKPVVAARAVAKPPVRRQTPRHRKPHDIPGRPPLLHLPMASREAARARDREDVTPLWP